MVVGTVVFDYHYITENKSLLIITLWNCTLVHSIFMERCDLRCWCSGGRCSCHKKHQPWRLTKRWENVINLYRVFVVSVFKGESVGLFARGKIYLGNSEVSPEKLNCTGEGAHLMDNFLSLLRSLLWCKPLLKPFAQVPILQSCQLTQTISRELSLLKG